MSDIIQDPGLICQCFCIFQIFYIIKYTSPGFCRLLRVRIHGNPGHFLCKAGLYFRFPDACHQLFFRSNIRSGNCRLRIKGFCNSGNYVLCLFCRGRINRSCLSGSCRPGTQHGRIRRWNRNRRGMRLTAKPALTVIGSAFRIYRCRWSYRSRRPCLNWWNCRNRRLRNTDFFLRNQTGCRILLNLS